MVSHTMRSLLEKKYENKMSENLHLRPLISYTANEKIPFLNIYTFEEAFSFPLVWELMDRIEATQADYVVDPFCGSGTTLFTSFAKGIPSVGVDALPLACFISETLPKFLLLRKGELKRVWKTLLPEIETSNPALIAADVPLMRVAFQKDILLKLRKMKTAIDELDEPYNEVFLVLFFSLLEECSRTVKVKRYPHVVNKKGVNPIDAMNKRVKTVETDITRAEKYCVRKENLPDVFLGNAKELSVILKREPTILITSPPYADKIDYTRSYALELCFHFVKKYEEFKKLQHTLVRSHAASKIAEEDKPPHPAVEEVVTALREKKDTHLLDMLTGYFLDMKEVLHEWYAVLSTHARVVVVVDNQYYQGEMIPTDLVLSDVAEEAGFTVKNIIVANYKRKNKASIRESILMWRK